ncbi:MAG: hypothetical protein ACRD5H_14465, partial [Nitrososphaerales archaeon]
EIHVKFTAVGMAGAGTAALPFAGLYSSSTTEGIVIREIKCFTLATNAARIRIVRATTAGTWTALTEKLTNPDGGPITGAAFITSSVAPTMEADEIDVGAIGAAIGSGFHYPYYGEGNGLWIPKGTGNGIVLIEEVDTANTYDFMFGWDPA